MLHSVTEFWVPRVISSADQPKQQINAFLAKNANYARPAWGVLGITELLARRYRFAYHFLVLTDLLPNFLHQSYRKVKESLVAI